jgi:hypothetical protein
MAICRVGDDAARDPCERIRAEMVAGRQRPAAKTGGEPRDVRLSPGTQTPIDYHCVRSLLKSRLAKTRLETFI